MKHKLLTAAALTTLMALPSVAAAQDFDREGWYLRGNVGAAGTTDMDIVGQDVVDLTGCARGDFLSAACLQNDINGDVESEYNVAGSLGLGYDFESPWRVEVDLGSYWNDTAAISQYENSSSDFRTTALMLNALYDFNEGNRFEPYVGAGVGFAKGELNAVAHSRAGIVPFNPNGQCTWQVGPNCVGLVDPVGSGTISDNDGAWAYQVMAGLGVNVTDTIAWDTHYRYVGMNDMDFTGSNAGGGIKSTLENPAYHALFTGLRWTFAPVEEIAMKTCWDQSEIPMTDSCPPEPVAMKTCWDNSEVLATATCPTRYTSCEDGTQVVYGTACPVIERIEYTMCPDGTQVVAGTACPYVPGPCDLGSDFVVYFEWDRSNLTDQARAIIQQAAAVAEQCAVTGLNVEGHADSSGNASYNVGLSNRRANIVVNELAKYGVSGNVTTSARGETELAIPTGDNVREPLNRRTEVRISLAPAIYN